MSAVPSVRPDRYVARKPEPPSVSAAPNASAAVASDATGYSPGLDSRMRRNARAASQPIATPATSPIPSCCTNSQSMSTSP